MKKIALILVMLCGLLPQAVLAAAGGWYQLDASWRDGSFSGQFLYDSASPYGIVEVHGTLTDLAQTTAITTVWNLDNAQQEAWVYLANSNPAELGGHDAGFYLYLVEQGGKLTLDTSASNSLYDWSSDFAYYNPAQLDESPLQSYSISAVPEPAAAMLLLAGLPWLAAAARARRRRSATM